MLPDRYEFLVYPQLPHGLEAGVIFCRDSVRFRSFEDDLIDDERWKQKRALIEETGLSVLKQPIEDHLAALEEHLEDRIKEVNRRIASGENDYIKVKQRGARRRWKLTRGQAKESVNHPVFDALRQVDISRVLHFVDRHSRFMDCFEHVRGRYVKGETNDQVIAACLVAWGTNMGLGRMGQISDIGYQRLTTSSDHFIRLETLREANDRVSNAIAALPLFRLYDNGDGTFTDVTAHAGITGPAAHRSASAADVNNDGLLDLLIAGNTSNAIQPNKLYLNIGNFEFMDISALSGLNTRESTCASMFSDYNGDAL